MRHPISVLLATTLLVGSDAGIAEPVTEIIEGSSFFADGFEFVSQLNCDPLELMSCNPDPSTSACFVAVFDDNTLCGAPFQAGQNALCQFVNGCNPGLSCMLLISQNLACTHQCDPTTGTTAHGTNCADLPELTEGLCVPISDYWAGTTIDHVGLCLDCALAENDPFCD